MSASILIAPERVLTHASATSKRALITELAGLLSSMDPDQVLEVVMAREHLGSTGIGHGVAIPHGRMPDLSEPVIALARHEQGIDFESIDGKPVHIVVLLLVPDSEDRTHLEILAKLARMLQQESIREQIMQAGSSREISDIFAEQGLQSA